MHRNQFPLNSRARVSALVSTAALVSALALMGMALGGCTTDSEAVPTAKIVSPKNGGTVVGPKVFLQVATTNFTFSGAAAAKSASGQAAVAGGHIHVFKDRPIGEDADAVAQLSRSDTVTLDGFTPGMHYLIIQGAQANHVDVESMVDSVMFTVTDP